VTRIRTLKPLVKASSGRTVELPPKRADPFYLSPEWRKLLAKIIAKRGRRCEDPQCRQPNVSGPIYGDHIIEIADGGERLDERNVLLRCASCHGKKTAAVRAKRLGV